MSNRINEKLATKLRTFPADDDSIVPVECPNERQFISDFVVITQYTKFSPTELQLKEKRKRIRSYSCFPAGFTYLIQDSLRMSSQVRHLGLKVALL
jgi:hypothetical protein